MLQVISALFLLYLIPQAKWFNLFVNVLTIKMVINFVFILIHTFYILQSWMYLDWSLVY